LVSYLHHAGTTHVARKEQVEGKGRPEGGLLQEQTLFPALHCKHSRQISHLINSHLKSELFFIIQHYLLPFFKGLILLQSCND